MSTTKKRIRYYQEGSYLINKTPLKINGNPITIKLRGTEATVFDHEGNIIYQVEAKLLIVTKIYLRRALDKMGLEI